MNLSARLSAKQVDNSWPFSIVESQALNIQRVHRCSPFFTKQLDENGDVTMRTLRPVYCEFLNKNKETRDCYLLYPFFRRHVTNQGIRWSFFNLIQKREDKEDPSQRRFRIFPLFSMDYSDKEKDKESESVFPFSGDIQNFFGNDTVSWFLFPMFLKTTKADETFYSAWWPIFRKNKGPNSGGGAVFPLWGYTWKENHYHKSYCLWPLMYDYKTKLNTDNPSFKHGVLPFYTYEKHNNLESLCFLWPFLGYTKKQLPHYNEKRFLWPFLVQGRGEVKYVNRWAPFFSHSRYKKNKKWFFLWPSLRIKQWEEGNVAIQQTQFFYFLFWAHSQKSIDHPDLPQATKNHIWPLSSMWDNGAGAKQMQIFSPLEPFFPHNQIVRNVYTPLFALYRYEKIKGEGTHHSLLFNIVSLGYSDKNKYFSIGPVLSYDHQEGSSSFEVFKGLLGVRKNNGKLILRLFWFNLG